MADITRVYLHQDVIPWYRRPILELLSAVVEVEFTIIAGFENAAPYMKLLDERRAKIRMKRVKTRIIRLGRLGTYSYQPQTVSFVIRHRPDVIVAGGVPYWLTSWALLGLGRILKIPVLLWTHGLYETETGPKWWIRRFFYKLARGLLLYGDHAKKLLVARGFDPASLYVVYNSLDYDAQRRVAAKLTETDIENFRRGLGVRQGEGLVAFVGRLQPVKRLDLLLHAVAALSRRGQRVHVALVGDGSEGDKLAALAADLDIADLAHFLGASYDEGYLGLVLSASDLSVLPSGAGLSVMHALGYGTPVLLHDRVEKHGPEWEAVEEGVTGFFYEYGSADDMAAKIERAIFPAPLKSRMADACKVVIADRYNSHRQAQEFVLAVAKTLACNKFHSIDRCPGADRID